MDLFSLPNMIDVALNSANRRDGATDVTVLLRGLQDAPLPSSVIDERREDFAPTLWRPREGVDVKHVLLSLGGLGFHGLGDDVYRGLQTRHASRRTARNRGARAGRPRPRDAQSARTWG